MNLIKLWQKDEKQSMKGWDFSYIKDRWSVEDLPFDYESIINSYLKSDHELLDMGTGGGEFLLSLGHSHDKTSATEGYEPNYQLCLNRLQPLGIRVKLIDRSGLIPFEDDAFDLVINKHSSYDIGEVKRVLKPGGLFISQQIGTYNNRDLSRYFVENFEMKTNHYLTHQVDLFVKSGFQVLQAAEYFPTIRFYDIGALVFFCKTIVWEFPDFSVSKYAEKLLDLHESLEAKDYIESKEHRFLLVCRKIGGSSE